MRAGNLHRRCCRQTFHRATPHPLATLAIQAESSNQTNPFTSAEMHTNADYSSAQLERLRAVATSIFKNGRVAVYVRLQKLQNVADRFQCSGIYRTLTALPQHGSVTRVTASWWGFVRRFTLRALSGCCLAARGVFESAGLSARRCGSTLSDLRDEHGI
jgi:hypothetical protein